MDNGGGDRRRGREVRKEGTKGGRERKGVLHSVSSFACYFSIISSYPSLNSRYISYRHQLFDVTIAADNKPVSYPANRFSSQLYIIYYSLHL